MVILRGGWCSMDQSMQVERAGRGLLREALQELEREGGMCRCW